MLGQIKVEGLTEFVRAARKSSDSDLPRRIGQTHRKFGQRVIDRLQPRPDPAAVGQGGGSAVRPSASKREVLLRVGGRHRAGTDERGRDLSPRMQWGKRLGRSVHDPAPKRPDIRGTVDRHRDELEQQYLRDVAAAFRPAFDSTEP